jgi:hypothetical protein
MMKGEPELLAKEQSYLNNPALSAMSFASPNCNAYRDV